MTAERQIKVFDLQTEKGNLKSIIDRVVDQASDIVLGKQHETRLALACLFARGHLLIEDLPGMGKTTLAHVLAAILGFKYNRIQFTSDLLPADILGVSIFNRETGRFSFHPGPIFAQLILADEVNRATPKAQSALLEAMEEQQVSIEGETRALPTPFFVIATQNPTYQVGTFPLPESQLDRFLMRIKLGYPDAKAERALLTGCDRKDLITKLKTALTEEQLIAIQDAVSQVHASKDLLDYLQAMINYTRRSTDYVSGLSPRGGLALLHSAKAWALMQGRDHVLPSDVQTVTPHVVSHRLHLIHEPNETNTYTIAEQLLSIPIP
ncbi:MAG: AAA domain-containing protein [Gammaproteobacteria bacterium]|nr:AAA domain-containing protein [Gammaproteobacteria bacterium]